MKVPVDDLNILVGLDGLALVQHEKTAVVEEVVTVGTAEAILRSLEAQWPEEELRLHRLLN